ncbi:restriction endonuclease subunit S [Acholeplasma sp. OttesenSCG-928-E16]|nr:restriction endonuclease subunit S [Acholeplasma sp. OttesenSCG-928-E16]
MSKYTFDEIAINCTEKKKPVENDKYTYLGLEHLDSETLKVSRFGSEVAPIGEKLLMKKGDILFGKRRAYQKKVAIAPFDGIFSAHGMVLRPKVEVIDPDFFPFFISSDYFLDTAIKISVGSLSPTINWKDLNKLEFSLPSIEAQKENAKLLWAIQKTLEAYKDLISKQNMLVKSEIREILKEKKSFTELRNYCDLSIETAKKSFKDDDDILYVEISSIDNEINEIVNPTQLLLKDAPESAKQVLKKGDVLVSLVRPNLKKIAVNKYPYNNVIGTSGFCILRPNEKTTSSFIQAIVLSDDFTSKMESSVIGSTYPTIKETNVLSYKVPIISSEEMRKITNLIDAGDTIKILLLECISELKASYKKIMRDKIFKED